MKLNKQNRQNKINFGLKIGKIKIGKNKKILL